MNVDDRTALAETLATMGDGATVEQDGQTYRFRVVPDDYCDILAGDDGDWYGNLALVTRATWASYPDPRPDGFDGRARKIQLRDGAVWWEPPADVTDPETLRTMRRNIADILEFGYSVFIVERCEGTDHYGAPVVADSTAMGGFEPFLSDEDVADVLADMLAEITPDDEPAPATTCAHCGRTIVNVDGRWVDPAATGDDAVWGETCDQHDTITAEHEPAPTSDPDEMVGCVTVGPFTVAMLADGSVLVTNADDETVASVEVDVDEDDGEPTVRVYAGDGMVDPIVVTADGEVS